ncbi:DsbA family oxidoreductase [Sediminibacillus massiliensis]|uniref:DsbA family oxidoreductase n=1 Tax=Sediminibacillus massiliensis TaxID=1926277 RepID=UPI0009883749|nr:DsbA family oxidoreductase [Sediminibacillus massiliensis]
MKIEIWSDFVCPFCYIGKRRLEIALDQFPHKDQVDIEYKSFELDPEAPTHTDQSIYEALAAKFGTSEAQVKQMNKGLIQQAAEIGLTYHYDNMKPTNTFYAHRLAKYAKTLGKEAILTEKLLYGYFTDSRNVGDIDTLSEIAEDTGIDKMKALRVLKDDNAYAEEVRQDENQARQLGISGVPYFVINQKYVISGAQPQSTFSSALQKIWEEEKAKTEFQDLSASSGEDTVCTDTDCIVPPINNND